ncbi:HIRAN domain-containing protein [Microbacterium sp. NPDC055903]
MTEHPGGIPAAWHADPAGRHQYRCWDGHRWTDWVADDGVQAVDPLHPTNRTASTAEASAASTGASHHQGTRSGYLLLGADGYPNTEVAGEFARVDSIHRAISRKPKRDEEIELTDLVAALVPEPSNPHDSNAIMVQINGQHVGYLEKEDAVRYRPVISRVWDAGFVAATRARVWVSARTVYDSKKLRYVARVTLALNEPHLLLPLNDPPLEDHSTLPWGSALQVTGEERHQGVLSRYMSSLGDGVVLGTLRVIQGGTARAPKDIVEVCIDDERIGQLTPGSSQHFVPTIRHLQAEGRSTAAWVRIKGNAIAAQATLQATKAHELSAEWFAAPERVPRLLAR